ncbi:amidase [Roseomonas sp. BN140053]|uniref:amidase n=1 Tax=Roseomonas sp. BN140053 TaxID=3391898 RepID=UPI0039ED27D9
MDEHEVGAFVPGERLRRSGALDGPLQGLTFAVKDLFDVAGVVTGYGNPDWARTHAPATATAPAVQALLDAGATLAGKTVTVELAYGLTGENVWYGTPINPAAPDRFPGGSSCGSAAAVAAGLVDFALGSDTGGSVRIPASYCGIWGIRPSWGAVSLAGARPLAPSFDTVGWFARDAATLHRAGAVLLLPDLPGPALSGALLKPQDAWMNAAPATVRALQPVLNEVEVLLGPALTVSVAPEGLDNVYEHFRAVQAEEAWASLGDWVAATEPAFGPGVGERFAAARTLDPADAASGRRFRRVMAARLRALLGGGAVMVCPTSPVPAPLLGAPPSEQQAVREATIAGTALAGMAGLCEVTIPGARVEGAPVGLSLIAAPGRDRALLDLAQRVSARLT